MKNYFKKMLFLFCIVAMFCISAKANEIKQIGHNIEEVRKIMPKRPEERRTTYRCFDAKNWKTMDDFYETMGKQLGFPEEEWDEESWEYPRYVDLMTMLWWKKNRDTITLVILNLTKFKPLNSKITYEAIVEDFRDGILPYWEGKPGTRSVVDSIPGGKPKKFNVYYT